MSSAEQSHLSSLQSGLASPDWVADCLAVGKGRSLVLRCLTHLAPARRGPVLLTVLSQLHLAARHDKEDARFWAVLAPHLASETLERLEPAAAALAALKGKQRSALLATSLGASVILTMVLKASLADGKYNA